LKKKKYKPQFIVLWKKDNIIYSMNKTKKYLLIASLVILLFLYFNQKENDMVVYIPEFLDNEDYQQILSLNNNKDNFMYESFRYAKPLTDKVIYDIFYNQKYMNKIQPFLNHKIYPSKFPIEHRIYSTDSPGMRWHKDLLMYKKPQYEAIFTLRNTTKSVTEWKDENNKLNKKWTEPNSLLIVKANGYEHHVTPPQEGEREILKLIYTQTHGINSNFTKEMERFKSKY